MGFQYSLKFSVSYPRSRVRKSEYVFHAYYAILHVHILTRYKTSRLLACSAVSGAERTADASKRVSSFTRPTFAVVSDVSSPPTSSPPAIERRRKNHGPVKVKKGVCVCVPSGSKNRSVSDMLLLLSTRHHFSRSGKAGASPRTHARLGVSGDGLDVRGGRPNNEDTR